MANVELQILVFLKGIPTSTTTPKIKVKGGKYEFLQSYAYDGRHILNGRPLSREEFNEIGADLYDDFRDWDTNRFAIEILEPTVTNNLDDYPGLKKAQAALKAKREAKKNGQGRGKSSTAAVRMD